MEGIVDRLEEDRVVLEVGDKYLIFKRDIFPQDLKEGDLVTFSDGSFKIDREGTEKRRGEIDSLFQSLIRKDD